PTATAKDGQQLGGLEGEERRVTSLFIDIRASTKLAEEKLPYDVLFILNQFFSEMSSAITETNGHYAQFNGDGLMALYGLMGTEEDGARSALKGARAM
ncbi:MAG TPA: ferredoxin, partial [Rhodospirillaceae bacterium]|nr:ferredoxin [Rhodospirillaceae bacterium]